MVAVLVVVAVSGWLFALRLGLKVRQLDKALDTTDALLTETRADLRRQTHRALDLEVSRDRWKQQARSKGWGQR